MATLSLVGSDTIIINDRVFTDLSTATVGTLTFENDAANIQVGKDQNAIFAYNAPGAQASLELRVVRGSNDDKFLNGLYAQQSTNFVGFTLMTGVLVKKIGDGSGGASNDSYTLSGGIFARAVDVTSNVEGDTEQGTSVWRFKFAKVVRTIG